MPRTLTKEKPIKKLFLDGLTNVIKQSKNETGEDEIWYEKPVNILEFCNDWIKESLFDGVQANFGRAMCGDIPEKFTTRFSEGHAFWGKGSGKDRTIAKILAYYAYKLMLLKNPQEYLRNVYGCSLADDEAIDLANVSTSARQAMNVFFKKLKFIIKRTKNPRTGVNFFVERGTDLRDGYGIQNNEIKFNAAITAHSLNSETNTGEGLNLFVVAMDEMGSFLPKIAYELSDAIRDTIVSRFKNVGKFMILSYKYYNDDPMDITYKTYKGDKTVYSSRRAVYDVNPLIKKSDLSKKYRRNYDKAVMTFECKGIGQQGKGYVTKKFMLDSMFSKAYENPVVGDLISVIADYLPTLEFEDWFKGDPKLVYSFRCDLGTGKVADSRDAAGFSLAHAEMMLPKIDDRLKKIMIKEGINAEFGDYERKGAVHDLVLQIVANKGSEIQFADIRELILRLKNQLGFNIIYGTFDGWQSHDSIQLLNKAGILVEEMSVDRDISSYDTWKSMMYQQLVKTYQHSIAQREARELDIINGKVDHPEKSWERLKAEGFEHGSKDVMDAISGNTKTVLEKVSVDDGVFFV